MKNCPFCNEQIQEEAKKCKFLWRVARKIVKLQLSMEWQIILKQKQAKRVKRN